MNTESAVPESTEPATLAGDPAAPPQVATEGAPVPQPEIQPSATTQLAARPVKNRGVAIVLALLLGAIGVHHFYLNNVMRGVLYLIFCWTGIPALIALFEGIQWALMTDETFQTRVVAVAH